MVLGITYNVSRTYSCSVRYILIHTKVGIHSARQTRRNDGWTLFSGAYVVYI